MSTSHHTTRLPTCWYCPECKRIERFGMFGGSVAFHEVRLPVRGYHYVKHELVEAPIIRPGIPPDELLAALRSAGLDARRADCDYDGWLPHDRGADILITELGRWGA